MYWYLATPYTKFPGGLDEAAKEASHITARYVEAGVPVFSPIVYGHALARENGLDPCDLKIWLPLNAAMIAQSRGLIVATMESWEVSKGVQEEIELFGAAGKPIYYAAPDTPLLLCSAAGSIDLGK